MDLIYHLKWDVNVCILVYVVIGNKDDDDNYAVRLYFKPFIYLIWLGAVMIFLATLSYPIKKSVLIFIGKKQKL